MPVKKSRSTTKGKCSNFVNANCSYNCPNAALELACDRWDLDPTDFGMERITCKECNYNDDNCDCEDCYVNGVDGYCKKAKRKGKKL